jgi:hypothetical protein
VTVTARRHRFRATASSGTRDFTPPNAIEWGSSSVGRSTVWVTSPGYGETYGGAEPTAVATLLRPL